MAAIEKTGQTDDPAATLETGDEPFANELSLSDTAYRNRPKRPVAPILTNTEMNHASQGRFTYPSGAKPLPGYTIKRGIGIGGFGEVYFALSDAGKEVAIKRIQRNLDVELRGVTQCLNLKHLNLISLWDIRTNDAGESWVVMEYVPGPSLRDLIEAYPNGMPEEQARLWFCSTAAGVSYLHDQGIVHRDLKPANIFYDEDQQVIKIGDYGLSKFISCSRRSGQTETVGTFHYMAPEIGKGIYGKEIDIYALGIVLFEMLTGKVPFDGESQQEIIMKHLTADPDLDEVPEGFREPLRRSMLKDPELRFNEVSELLAALPWNQSANVEESVSRSSANTDHSAQPAGLLINDVDVELVERGIYLGPLKESNAGTPSDPIRFIEPELATHEAAATLAGNPEPIAQAVQGGYSQLTNWWYTAPMSTPLKVGVLVVIGLVVVANSAWLLPLALALGLVYLVYYAIRAWLLTPSHEVEEEPVEPPPSRKEILAQQRRSVQNHLARRSPGETVSELLGSMLVAAVACVLFNLIGMTIGGSIFDASVDAWALYAWSTLTSVAGCWGLLIASKSWEHRDGDPWLRRLTMGGIGLLVGLVAFSSATLLNVDLTEMTSPPFEETPTGQFVIQGVPVLPAYLVFFMVLFGILRWWRQADPTRKTRLSIWSVGVCLIWAAVFSHVLGFDPVWNCVLAVVISISTQLAAPWVHPESRESLRIAAGQQPTVAGS